MVFFKYPKFYFYKILTKGSEKKEGEISDRMNSIEHDIAKEIADGIAGIVDGISKIIRKLVLPEIFN